jgi:hypothetical protein
MVKCEVCGNEYDKAFEVGIQGRSHTFDCFECAIQALSPVCALRMQDHWSRRGEWRRDLLLRQLRPKRRRARRQRPRRRSNARHVVAGNRISHREPGMSRPTVAGRVGDAGVLDELTDGDGAR